MNKEEIVGKGELTSVLNKLNFEISEDALNKFEATFIEGLKRKGYEFESKKDLFSFAKENCRCVDNPDLKEIMYYVNEEPFLVHNYKVTMDFKYSDKNTFSADLGSYAFIN